MNEPDIINSNDGYPGDSKNNGVHLSTDTGGTFTDFVYIGKTGLNAFKRLSTPDDPTRSIKHGIQGFSQLDSFSHGTTVATNAVLERKEDPTALVTTKGFKDVIFIGRQQRQHLYNFKELRPVPLIGREDVFEVTERVTSDGEVQILLNRDEVEQIGALLLERGYRSVAICYLFSFLNPEHEIMTMEILKGKGLNVSRSSQVLPEYREFERTSTTLMDAFVSGKIRSYLDALLSIINPVGLREFNVMESEGGVAPSIEIIRVPSKGLLSGPAGGVSGALHLGELVGMSNMITLDMGGTSTDIARITGLRPEYSNFTTISGLPISRRCLNIVTIGAGGGSISRIDSGGAIRVGPESAGASPGPICYDLGGDNVTVTDINLLAGSINPKDFLGNGRDLNVPRTRERVEKLASRLGYSQEEVIKGVRRVVNHNMASALRMVTTEAGKDPGDYTLFSFGGAGSLHAVDLAKELGMRKVFVPFVAGMFSAYGILISDVVHGYSVTKVMPLDPDSLEKARYLIEGFRKQGSEALADGEIPDERQVFYPSLDIRYKGQSYALNVPFSEQLEEMLEAFGEQYLEMYGYSLSAALEIVNIRLEARGKRDLPPLPIIPAERSNEPYELRKCLFEEWIEVPVFKRSHLGAGFGRTGEAIIEDDGSTILIPPGSSFEVDSHGNLGVRT